jgi:hypothetical protein
MKKIETKSDLEKESKNILESLFNQTEIVEEQ